MRGSNQWMPHRGGHASPLRGLPKRFGDLKIRPKLMVLHNLFFFVLALAVYASLITVFESRVASARDREIGMLTELVRTAVEPGALPALESYGYEEGSAGDLNVPSSVVEFLEARPGAGWSNPAESDFYYYRTPAGQYRKIRLPYADYAGTVERATLTLFIVLGVIYILAVLLLELEIMPLYVYRPVRLMLEADAATMRGDRAKELIPENLISDDEIGHIMRSRNETVSQLRKQEDDLAEALSRLEEAAQDLTRKNHLLETAKRNLADQDRLVSLGMMSASVAHEMNTPLAVLHGSIEKLVETTPAGPSRDRLDRMHRVTERLRKISISLLDFARVRKHEMEPLEIGPVVREAWELVAIDEKASHVRFEENIEEGLLVTGNADRLIQVFVNVLKNSLHAVKDGGRISVRGSLQERDGRAWASIRVEDDGKGIPPDVLPHIFEAFITSRLDARGTGLGLTVAEGIIHQHGGTIEATNRTGGGACLEIALPAARRRAAA